MLPSTAAYINPACQFTRSDIIPDSDITCPADIAVEARITFTMANCTTTQLDLAALATTISSVVNISACALELDFVSSEELVAQKRRHLTSAGDGRITLLLLAFVPTEQAGTTLIADFNTTATLAALLAMLDGNIGAVIDIEVTTALAHLSSATSDPHFVTPFAEKFDFNGVAGQTYCIITDKRLHVNARFIGTAAESSPATKASSDLTDPRTWMDQVSVLHGDDQVLVDAASAPGTPYTASFGSVLVNGVSTE
eukprot:jgi/Mesvir1/13809/Mv15963-RA.1